MGYDKIKVPAGDKIEVSANGALQVPDRPVITFIEGDGIGPDITKASMHIWNSAIRKAYGGKRQISWMEVYAGEKANAVYGPNTWLPDETLDAIAEHKVSIKGPLSFEDCAVTLKDEDDLTAVIVGMHSDSRTGYETSLEYAVGAVEEHVGGKFLLSAFEFGEMRNLYFVEFQNHIISFFQVTDC